MRVVHMNLGMMGTNSYLVIEGNKALIVDLGGYSDRLTEYLDENGLTLEYILLTHGHFDHISGIGRLSEKTGAKICISAEDEIMLTDNRKNGSADFRIPFDEVAEADIVFSDGDIFEFEGIQIKVIATPGHTKGGVCYLIEDEKILFSGDSLFRLSIGRTDLYGGDMRVLLRSLKEKILVLDDDITVCPGHGELTSIGFEKENNPYTNR